MNIEPIAKIYTQFKEKFGIPRQSGRGKNLLGKIVFESKYNTYDAVKGIEGFSHLWLIFDFSKNHREKFSATVRPPRLGGNTRVGVFASRSPFRPNNLGLSSVRLLEVKSTENGPVLIVEGVDLLDETPIYDIKPYLLSDCHIDAKVGYSDQLHKLKVEIDKSVKIIEKDILESIISCLEEDPRPSYQDDSERVYIMAFDIYEVHFKVSNGVATVIKITAKGKDYEE